MPVSLTVYNEGTALVKDRRTFEIAAGTHTVDFTDVTDQIDATSVSFVSLTDPNGTFVLEQNFVYDLVSSTALMQRYLDETIEVTLEDGTLVTGQLLSSGGNALILRRADGPVVFVRLDKMRDVRFPSLPGGLVTRPTLRWLVQSAQSGLQDVEVTYLSGGLNWTADYNILLARDNTALDLNGWVTLTNTSGATFTEAQVKLVAGEVQRIKPPPVMMAMRTRSAAAFAPPPEPQVEQREIFEYNLYELRRRVTVGNNETKQVEFVAGTGVPATTFFVYDAGIDVPGAWRGAIMDQHYGTSAVKHIQVWLEFSTGEENGLGADLPAGRMRVYQEDVDEAALLIGENRIKHTPKGEVIKLKLGAAFDLVGERKQTEFRLVSKTALVESYEIRLRNRKDDQTVEIRVPETLFRWSNWEMLRTSHTPQKLDSNTIEFRVEVPPGGETVITYTVRYSWPK
jgi:hypothetical protein